MKSKNLDYKTLSKLPINNHPYKKKVVGLRRSITSTEYYKKLQSFKIKINNYINVSEKYVNVLDYIIDSSLDSFSSNKLLQSFNYYRLTFSENQLITLSKIKNDNNFEICQINSETSSENLVNNTNNRYEFYSKTKNEYIKKQLQSLFETTYLACRKDSEVKKIQKNFRIYNLHKKY